MHDLGTDKTVKHKASLKTGKRITIHRVEHYEVLDTSFWPINIEKDTFKKKKKKRNPNISNLIFSSVALQVPQPLALNLLLTVFSHAQHDTAVCMPTNLCSGKTPFCPNFKRHSFYLQHCQYKSASCLPLSNRRI